MSYEIRALSFGEILDTGFRLLRNHFVLLAGIPAVLYLPPRVGQAIWLPNTLGAVPDPQQVIQLVVVAMIFALLLYPVVAAAVTHAIGTAYLGRPEGIGAALRTGFSLFLPLVGTSILAGLVGVVGAALPIGALALVMAVAQPPALLVIPLFLLAMVPIVYLVLAFLLLQQVMVLERRFGFAALMRSHELMKGRKLRGFGIMMVSALLVMVLSGALGILGLLLGPFQPLVEGVAQAIGMAYGAAVLVVFYFDLRCRDEAFDLEHLARLVEADRAPPSGAPYTA